MPAPSEAYRYFELYYENEVYGFAALDLRFPPFCLLHLEVMLWNHLIYAEILNNDWPFAKKFIKSLGFNVIALTKKGTLADQASYVKLIKKCGFPTPVEFTQSSKEI